MLLKIFLYSLSLCLLACNNSQTIKTGRGEFIVLEEKQELEKIIDFSTMTPAKVQFVYEPMGKQDDTDLLPGPTDYKLEAVLYFKTSERINRRGCSPVEQNQFSRDDFNFSWLAEETKNELKKMPVDSRGNNASCFYKGVLIHGSCFYLRDKILLILFTN
jgi:hypothetical protein